MSFPSAESLAQLALNGLAVAGGYLAGHVLGGLVAWGLDRWVFAKKSPDFVKKLTQIVCGLLLAILVALIVFGKGGGSGGGSGDGQGKGSGDPADTPGKADAKTPDPARPPVKVDVPKVSDVDPTAPQVAVTVLAGAAARGAEQKFYYLGTTEPLVTFDDVKREVGKRKAEAGGKQLLLLVVFPANPAHAPPDRAPSVTQLVDWAEREGVRVERVRGR